MNARTGSESFQHYLEYIRFLKRLGVCIVLLWFAAPARVLSLHGARDPLPHARTEEGPSPRPITGTQESRNVQAGRAVFQEAETLLTQGSTESTQKAIEKYEEALRFWEAAREEQAEAVTLSRLSVAYAQLGNMQKALDYDDRSLRLARSLKDPIGEATVVGQMGSIYARVGETRKALDFCNRALALYESLKDIKGQASTFDEIADLYQTLGEKQRALEYFNQALPLQRSVGDRAGEARTLNALGMVYDDLGEKQKALDYYSDAIPLWQAVKSQFGEAETLNNVGAVFIDSGDKEKALYWLNQALHLVEAGGNLAGKGRTLTNIGWVYVDSGEVQKALDYFNQALVIMRTMQDREGEAGALHNVGMAYDASGEKQKALDTFNQALPLFRALGKRHEEGRILNDIAAIERDQGKLEAARTHSESGLAIFESLRNKFTRPELRTSFSASVQSYYELYIDILMRLHELRPSQGYDQLAFEASERGRARSLLETLAEANADIRKGVDSKLLQQKQSLEEMLDSKSASMTRILAQQPTPAQAHAAEKEIDDLLSQYRDIEAQIRAASPHYAALTQPQPLTVKEIQQQFLDPDTLLLEFSLGQNRSYLWAVTPNSMNSYTLPKRDEIESQAVKAYGDLTQQRALRADHTNDVTARFSQMVLGPVASQLGRKRLAIAADGALNYIPFGSLPAPSNVQISGNQPLLVVDHQIVYLPSASTVAVMRQENGKRPPAPKLLALMADPVFSSKDERVKARKAGAIEEAEGGRSSAESQTQPRHVEAELAQTQFARSAQESGITRGGEMRRLRFTRQEAENAASFVPEDMLLLDLDFAASKVAAMSPELGQYRMVHFATHGSLDGEHPELSGLILSMVDEQGSPVNGFLRLHDIFNLSLPADLVVLSACETGLGKVVRGEGLVSLTRGFMYAGALRVVVSLWNVDDQATAELMRRFYQAILKDGLPPVEALRVAQLSMRNDPSQPRWSAPYYWAAFVLQGEWR